MKIVNVHCSKGYTLYELCIVLLLVTILGSVSVPAICKTLSSTRTEREAKKIAHWLELMALKAAYLKDDVTLTEHNSELEAHALHNPKKALSKRLMAGDTKIQLGRDSLRFYHSGVSSPASIRVSGRDGICILRLSLRGRVTIECNRS